MRFALAGAEVFDGETLCRDAAVIVDGPRIAAVVPYTDVPSDVPKHDLGGGLLAPGFVDAQVNGGGGALLNEAPSLEVVRRIAEAHRAHGTVALMPTVITDAPETIDAAVDAVRTAIALGLPGVLGIHIEGPFLDPRRKGAHDERFIRTMTEADADRLAALDCGRVMVTLAPDRVAPGLVRRLAQAGVRVSLGHSDATAAETNAALAAGATAFTHLYNAMSQMTGREASMAGAALSHAKCYAGIIADGHHVARDSLRAAFAALGSRRLMLVSDAMPSAAGGPDRFQLQGREVTRIADRLTLEDGTLAGATITLVEAVRHCVHECGIAREDALRMATATPASFLGVAADYGHIRTGAKASLVHLGQDLNVRSVWVDGVRA